MKRFLIYRNGANAANQSMYSRIPVAIVEASTVDEAIATTRDGMTVHDPAYMVLATHVNVWANQTLDAVPEANADVEDWNAIVEFGEPT